MTGAALGTESQAAGGATVRVVLPGHLRKLALLGGSEVSLEVDPRLTHGALLDALESRYPVLAGMVRDRSTNARRPFVRFFACGEDVSHEGNDARLPPAVCEGTEVFVILGAMAGG